MPQNGTDEKRPPAMTWGRAAPIIIVAGVFDAARVFFTMFWFFGPALVAAYCAAQGGDVAVVSSLFTAGCVAVAGAVGFTGAPVLGAFGTVMAMAVGFSGWLVVGGLLLLTNARIFKENAAWFVVSLAVSEVPLIGALPVLSGTIWRMYRRQITLEKAAQAAYDKKHIATSLRARQEQAAALGRAQQQEAANEGHFSQEQAANENHESEEIPEEVRRAA